MTIILFAFFLFWVRVCMVEHDLIILTGDMISLLVQAHTLCLLSISRMYEFHHIFEDDGRDQFDDVGEDDVCVFQ